LDNQIIVLSGNDAHSLLWDGFNNAYTSSIVSVANEQLLRTPIDEASYVDKTRAGSRYMFIVNEDGTMAIYQTLISENVSGFTPAELEQSYGEAYFRWVTSNFDGRAWFLTERQLGTNSPLVDLTGNTSDTFTAVGSNFSTTQATAWKLSAVGVYPVTTPQITTDQYYWARGIDNNTFYAYTNKIDAEADTNRIEITDFGTGAKIEPWPLVTRFFIEQLSFDAYVDCAGFYSGAPTSVITSPSSISRFNAQTILMQGDGFGFSDEVTIQQIQFKTHGQFQEMSETQYDFAINMKIQPLPISITMSGNPKSSNLLDTKHIRYATFLFADTVGGTITQDTTVVPIQMQTFSQANPGEPPAPTTGSFEMSIFGGWNDFQYNSFTINHSEPFDMKLTGIFYKVDV
jgi:hypothetical protein